MVLVIFRSRLREGVENEYGPVAKRMSELVSGMPGFISFKTFAAPDGERVSIMEFETEEAVEAWRKHSEHLVAQQRGRQEFYSEYQVQVCPNVHAYGFKSES
ncbi:MAG TPA: antibiotic biosynthesis monooxygenase [Candidatus Obscuribacterales bacterium]